MQATQSISRPATLRLPWLSLIFGAVLALLILISYLSNAQMTTAVLNSTLRQSTPIILGALAGIMCERSGVVNIGIEGMMLLAAFLGFLFNVWTGNLFAGGGRGRAGWRRDRRDPRPDVDHAQGRPDHQRHGHQYPGDRLHRLFLSAGPDHRGQADADPHPGAGRASRLSGTVFFNNPPITYLALILVVVIHFVLFKTRWGLRTRAVGEHPTAADTVGIRVNYMRYVNVIIGGMLAGLAGGFLTLEAVGSFERNMTNGRGFVALAVMIFGKWTPFGAWGGALLFGFANGLQTQIQFLQNQLPPWLAWVGQIPHQFIGLLPYVLTIVVLAGFVGRARPPAALGKVYEKE